MEHGITQLMDNTQTESFKQLYECIDQIENLMITLNVSKIDISHKIDNKDKVHQFSLNMRYRPLTKEDI